MVGGRSVFHFFSFSSDKREPAFSHSVRGRGARGRVRHLREPLTQEQILKAEAEAQQAVSASNVQLQMELTTVRRELQQSQSELQSLQSQKQNLLSELESVLTQEKHEKEKVARREQAWQAEIDRLLGGAPADGGGGKLLEGGGPGEEGGGASRVADLLAEREELKVCLPFLPVSRRTSCSQIMCDIVFHRTKSIMIHAVLHDNSSSLRRVLASILQHRKSTRQHPE